MATKHAVVFSNNRIKPDMLPDLDKPSLKEMGITLMGDMIAILRYAKKVSEEMTCERFLVDTADPIPPIKTISPKVVPKRVASKVSSVANKSMLANKSTLLAKDNLKITKTTNLPVTVPAKKKIIAKVINKDNTELQARKRKIVDVIESIDSESEEEWSTQIQKRLKIKTDNDKVDYKIVVPKTQTARTTEVNIINKKKIIDQKRTVFDRLGDSSVTSTTNTADANTTFNITGLGSEVLKRNSSVFNRLGDRDAKKETATAGILKNGNTSVSNGQPQGILKSRVSNIGTTTIKLTKATGVSLQVGSKKVTTGTMHADHERNQKVVSSSVKQLVRKTKALNVNKQPLMAKKIIRKIPVSKLGNLYF